MKILIIIILMDIFIFTLGAIFAEKEYKIIDSQKQSYRIDRYGYSWKVEE